MKEDLARYYPNKPASGRAPLPGNLKDEVFEKYANALLAGLPLIGALLGNLEEIHFPGHVRKTNSTSEYLEVTRVLSLSEALTSLRHIYLGSFLLNPEDNRKLSIGVIWSHVGGIELP
jgi:hypothetical protein